MIDRIPEINVAYLYLFKEFPRLWILSLNSYLSIITPQKSYNFKKNVVFVTAKTLLMEYGICMTVF